MLEQILIPEIKAAVKSLYGIEAEDGQLQLQKTKKEFAGHVTLIVFPFVKMARKAPAQVAAEIGEHLKQHTHEVADYNAVGGYLNLVISDEFWFRQLQQIDSDEHYGHKAVTDGSPLMMVEYSSPNTNKPLHLGHVRNNLLGNSIARIQAANGWRVVRTNIVNDRGIHICKSMLAWLKWGNGATPESTGKKGDHLVGDYYVEFDKHYRAEVRDLQARYESGGMSAEDAKQKAEKDSPLMQEAHDMLVKWEQGDEEVRSLWRKMNKWVYDGFDQTYAMMGVGFDKIYYESDTYLIGKKEVEEGLQKGLFHRRTDGSVWADLTQDGLDEKLLLRADGTSVYMTQDIGTAKLRYQDYPIDKMVYVVGNEQDYHFQVLSILLDRLGFKWGKDLVHFSYGMVELPNGKMKSREGTVVDADDLMADMIEQAKSVSADKVEKLTDITDEEKNEIARRVGLGALKYFILKVDPKKNMLFDPEKSIDFNGNTGPFIQYTYARIQSILRKSGDASTPLALRACDVTINEKEQALIQRLAEYPSVVEQAGKEFSPALIANYVYELVKEYNQFYHDYSVLNEPDDGIRAMRVLLSKNVARVTADALNLLGIEAPERM